MQAPWWRIAWRNLGRNRRRTVITAAALAFGYVSVVVMIGLSKGLVSEMIDNGTRIVDGQIQVHRTEYLPDRAIYETIGGPDGADVAALLRIVADEPGVEAAAPRVYGSGLVSSGATTSAGILLGVEPDRERDVTRFLDALVSGRAPEPGSRDILIGTELARQLEVGLGDELVLVAPAADGSLGNDLYTVSGLYETGFAEFDRTFAILPLASLQGLLALDPDRIHEIAAAVVDPWMAPDIARRLQARLSGPALDAEVEPWTELRPEMADYARLASSSNWIIIVIVFGMAIFGVANTMLMVTFERRREFAVLMALGTTPPSIVRTVVYESVVLSLVSLVIGVALSTPILIWWHNAPPDLSWLAGGFTMAGALIRPVLRVEYAPALAGWSALALVLTAILAALYPAIRAARVPPADALSGE